MPCGWSLDSPATLQGAHHTHPVSLFKTQFKKSPLLAPAPILCALKFPGSRGEGSRSPPTHPPLPPHAASQLDLLRKPGEVGCSQGCQSRRRATDSLLRLVPERLWLFPPRKHAEGSGPSRPVAMCICVSARTHTHERGARKRLSKRN